jgi:site-specific DNA-methyltransferase (adenine-specific)
MMQLFFTNKAGDFSLYQGEAPGCLFDLVDNSVDFVFADPPYLLSNDGTTVRSGKRVSVNKADWDRSKGGPGFNFTFQESWIRECHRILKPGGVIAISGTMHSIFSCGHAIQMNDYQLLNDIIWYKSNCAPNIGCRCFTNSHETIVCAHKKGGKHIFNYEAMKSWVDTDDFVKRTNKQMRDVFSIEEEVSLPDTWSISSVPLTERKEGKYPTQKPLKLLRRLLSAFTNPDSLVLDPFTGSSTTGLVAHELGRKFVGIDLNSEVVPGTELTALTVSKNRYLSAFPEE